ncbi:MAG: hypothetical protein IJ971_07685 [Bacteroidales bacterium]|nr:hypothetical protein [Bacteroidales bacterium]
MKRIITLLAILAISAAAHAQTDSLMTVNNEGLNLNVAGFSVTLGGKAEPVKAKKRYRPYGTNVFGIKWGVTRMTDSPYYGRWDGMGDFLNLSGKSNSLSIEPISWNVALDRKRITWIQVGANLTWDNYHFFNPKTLLNNQEGYLMPYHLEGKVKKTTMNTFYLGASFGLGFRIGNIKLGANATPEVLCYAESRYRNPKKSSTEIQGLNPIRLKAGVTMMVDVFGLYVDYGLTPVFKDGTGNDAHMASIGLKLGF